MDWRASSMANYTIGKFFFLLKYVSWQGKANKGKSVVLQGNLCCFIPLTKSTIEKFTMRG
jgi:hypothetical protein